VTATDPVEAFISPAEQAGSADDYKVAAVTNLPFADDTFDLAIAYNVLMDIDYVPTALREIGRVLRPLEPLLSPLYILLRIAAISLAQSQMLRLSSITLISVVNASRQLRSGTDCRCTSPGGHSPQKTTCSR